MSGNKISLSLGGGRKPPPPSNGIKRPRAALQDEEEDASDFGMREEVSHFDNSAGGAIDAKQKKQEATGPLTIQSQANRDWREKANARKRQKSGIPDGPGGNSADLDARVRDVEAKVEAAKPKYGLNTYKKSGDEDDCVAENGRDSAKTAAHPPQPDGEHADVKQKTDDELAVDALLGKTSTNKHLVIAGNDAPMSESDAFGHDFASAPASATLDDYARMPVEQFGAALLRGMGWKDGEGIGSQKGKKLPVDAGKLPVKRANLLGIGAKEDAAVAQEMGAWGRASKGKDVKIYNPVLLRDKKTGELYTEEELERKKQKDERSKYEMEFEEKERDKKSRRERHGEASRGTRRDRDHGRDRSKDRNRRRHDSDSEEEYHRQKERDRRRRREREREEDDYERERSHRHRHREDGDRERHGDKDRRDRDRERDRRR